MYSKKLVIRDLACLVLALPGIAFGQVADTPSPEANVQSSTAQPAVPAEAAAPASAASPASPAPPANATQASVAQANVTQAPNATEPQALVDADGTFKAIWKPQIIDFTYQSFTSLYSCDAFISKIKLVLTNLGARKDLKVRLRGCEPLSMGSFDRGGGDALGRGAAFSSGIGSSSQVLRARIEVSAPVVATAEALADLDKGKSQRELLIRARGKRPEDAIETEQFQAGVQRVALNAGSGDCQLIEQLRDQVMPKLGIRVVNNDVKCVPGSYGNNELHLEVEAMVAAPRADEAPATAGFAPK